MKIEQIANKRGYFVTEDGEFINSKGDKIGSVSVTGYLTTKIRVDGVGKSLTAHRLQAYQKYGTQLYGEGIEVRHKNNDKLDNSWCNILIGNHSDNMLDIPKQIRIKKALHATSFVRKHKKEEIKKFHSESKSYKKTMEEFNINSKGTLHYILNN